MRAAAWLLVLTSTAHATSKRRRIARGGALPPAWLLKGGAEATKAHSLKAKADAAQRADKYKDAVSLYEKALEYEAKQEQAGLPLPAGFSPGTAVVVQGLQSRPELNGLAAVVLNFDEASGRFYVRLSEGPEHEVLALRPACLAHVPPGLTSSAAARREACQIR